MAMSVIPVRILFTAILLALTACATVPRVGTGTARFQDPSGRPIEAVTIGENFQIGATGLNPRAGYEFNLWLGDRRVGFSRVQADERGTINPLILWHQSGVVGCGGDIAIERARRPVAFRDFDEAEQALNGQRFRLELREANPRAITRETAMIPSRSPPVAAVALPARRSPDPTVFPSTADGCLLNSAEAGSRDMHVSGRGFIPGETIELAVVANQIEWHVGDLIGDLADADNRLRVRADANGRFTTLVWNRGNQQRGAYDIIARRVDRGQIGAGPRIVRAEDVVSSGLDTAYILFLYYPPGGTQMDVAGRTVLHYPYFEFADSFATANDDVWGGVDPTYVVPNHPGGTHAAYYVVPHRNVAQWTSATNLTDVSGLIEVTQVKSWCINGTYMPIWQFGHPVGSYDVVVNFGSVPATSTQSFVDDFTYDSAIDFLDGAIQIGFVVLPDPNDLGPMAIGQTSYSVDNAFALSAQVSAHHGPSPDNVDLRAVVRYPATAAGVDTPVAPGAHPLFIMQHGNHSICNVGSGIDHVACPANQRKRNHEGYMRLLDALASRGIIAVSVDAYDVTGAVPQWIPERADLNLKHLEFWSHLNNAATFPTNASFATQTNMANRFTGHVDMAHISVSGHSRGGEASVSTYVRNQARPLAQRFSITSISSIAPVDGQQYALNDVPYFVILPAADGDVWDLSGVRIYDRSGGAAALNVRSGIDVYGASHNFFNTIWAADGDDGAAGRPDFIPAVDQQRIGESYIAAFTLSNLLGMSGYEDMLRGRLGFASTAGRKIYHFRHDVPFLRLDDGTAAGPVATSLTAASLNLASPAVHRTFVKQLTWNTASPSFRYSFSPTNLANFEVLSFRVAQTNAAANTAANLEFLVELFSGANVRSVYSGSFGPIPRPYNRAGTDQNVMSTIRIPLHSFIMNNSPVNLTGIDSVQIRFTVTNPGDIYVDDVEFSR